MSDTTVDFARDWDALATHVRHERSDLVLLPEMPFAPWIFDRPTFEPSSWRAICDAHDAWCQRLVELSPAAVVTSRPSERNGQRFNEAIVWDGAVRPVHTKRYLPDETGFWEATWYSRGDGRFEAASVAGARVGVVVCSELWFFDHARAHGLEERVELLLNPRATQRASLDLWLAAARSAAVVSGAFCLSSNRVSDASRLDGFGGGGWVVDPDGTVLGCTTANVPFLTVEVDLDIASRAKATYPRYLGPAAAKAD